ncbi:MAG: hypothetical protein K0R94_940, partial [Burkholderiales bacterium]|nr:hypothetical protein [Burkholderiales bacterium]
LFTLDHPGVIGKNKDSVEYFYKVIASVIPESREIVNISYVLRNTPANSVVSISPEKLRLALLPLYTYCISRYQNVVLGLGNTELANQLATEEKRLST